ncbi:biotin synthase BioB [Heliophilum fasciatum]|uniref:Biotin synthase n=1 Tax=Heliophilum fasciatum TaxID=35700 RepID=A0A4R2RZJ2_9FIRM|nr:biotin synthase BioB [Heliophilum fasciatum]MCW2276599.1 biotin synthase [Heliophilum fasciatum]TCP69018.1 biotin synthase [Heliophilum fasciatum]
MINELKAKIYNGYEVSKNDALMLAEADLEELCTAANEIRRYFCGAAFDLCTIINGKSGKCSENCKFCAQSTCYETLIEEYPLLEEERLIKGAVYHQSKGILRYSVVTSGRCLDEQELDDLCQSYHRIRQNCAISLCASHGLLTYAQFLKLKGAGVTRYHNNLETSRRNFPNICTTHTYEDKINAIKAAQQAGLEVCSGGILGLGETMEDRIDMVLDIRALGIKSVPVNILNPIAGTPFAKLAVLSMEEVRRAVAIFRFMIPSAAIRLAGGRGLLTDKGKGVFQSGANAAISGDMLTTAGICIDDDLNMLDELSYRVKML